MRTKCIYSICLLLFVSFSYAQDSLYHRAKIWDETIQGFLEQDKANPPSAEKLILFIGSSSFTRWDHMSSYFPGYNVLNRGFGSSLASDLIYYADRIIFPYKPSQVVIYEGDNDLAGGLSVDEYMTDVQTLVRLIDIQLPGVPVVLLSVKSSPRRDATRTLYEEANARMYAYALSKKQVTFVDVYSLLLDSEGNYKTGLYAPDSLHINEEAYRLWAERITPHLIK